MHTFFFWASWGTRTDSFSVFGFDTPVGSPAGAGKGDAAIATAFDVAVLGVTTVPLSEPPANRASASARSLSISASGSPSTPAAIALVLGCFEENLRGGREMSEKHKEEKRNLGGACQRTEAVEARVKWSVHGETMLLILFRKQPGQSCRKTFRHRATKRGWRTGGYNASWQRLGGCWAESYRDARAGESPRP